MRKLSARLSVLSVIGMSTLAAAQLAPVVLITSEEANQPPPKGAVAMAARGVTRGPKIEFVSPAAQTSPIRLSIKFQSYGGAAIDPATVRMVYLRASNVEVTPRIKPYVTGSGIEIPQAELPPGNHVLRVDLKDTEGRAASTSFTLNIDSAAR